MNLVYLITAREAMKIEEKLLREMIQKIIHEQYDGFGEEPTSFKALRGFTAVRQLRNGYEKEAYI
jgi:hypothetical protein